MNAANQDSVRRVVLAGATGWAGSALARGIGSATELELVGAVSRTHAGRSLSEVVDGPGLDVAVSADIGQALSSKPDVVVEYTKPDVAKSHILSAIDTGAHVVVGTSGLSTTDYTEIGDAASRGGVAVLACGNFALTAVLMMKFSTMAARWIKQWEVIDYASSTKVDAPSGTARELANHLAAVGPPDIDVPIEAVAGSPESRGTSLDGTQVHSVRLPGFVISIESIFGMAGQKLVLRHEAGSSPEPYVEGALMAIRRVHQLPPGLHRGLDRVMED
jgi:4-hydroxy-tetrahydrodipicolinate reductase